jgi:nucleoside-diphosphate-sugar epimerase
MSKKILIIGACGQIGTELTQTLRNKYGKENVVAADIREGQLELMESGPFELLDATDGPALSALVENYEITEIYLMAAMLSATAEKYPERAWNLNMNSLFNVLSLAREKNISRVFWPSSIAVFGKTTPRINTPQFTVMEPGTVYGISKQAGERWCEYYFNKFGVDVRSLRYPGLISWKTDPGGGTTDYAVEIFHEALKHKSYTSFLGKNTRLPMMYMDDAIRATIELMEADPAEIQIRSAYNIGAMSFTPEEIAQAIQKHLPEFNIGYQPDFRQTIADSWPESIDDTQARKDWGWRPLFDLDRTVLEMLTHLDQKA